MPKRSLISADNHVFEPVTLWQERLPEGFRDRGPRVEERDDWLVMAIEGMPDRKLTRLDRGDSQGQASASHEAGMRAGGFDLAGRLRDMALDGVVAEVIYPTFGLFIDMVPAPDLQMACARVYNDWLAESFLDRPDVFIPAAVVPVRDVETAAAELERVAQLGFKAAMIPTSAPVGMPYNQPVYDPLWQIASDARMPLSLHTGTGALPQFERGPGGAVINYAKVGLLSAETLVLLRRVGSARAVPAAASRVRGDGRGLVRVLLRADGRGLRGARAVGEPEARPPAVGIREGAVPRDARRGSRATADA